MTATTTLACASDISVDDQSLKIAFASSDGDLVDQHFGSAQGFFLYGVNENQAELLGSKSFPHALKDGNEDKLKPRLAWLAGADIVYCASIGGSATRQLIALGVNPIKVGGGPDVEELIESIQQQLQGEPEPWLRNILRVKGRSDAKDRFDDMDDDGWSE